MIVLFYILYRQRNITIIRKQVSSFIDKKGCLNSTQHRFRSGRSCLSAMLCIFDDIMHMLEADGSVDMVYLYFSKAFHNKKHLESLEILVYVFKFPYKTITFRKKVQLVVITQCSVVYRRELCWDRYFSGLCLLILHIRIKSHQFC